MKTANDRLQTIVQIESREGLDNLEEIIKVPGVDMVSSGKADLAQALGIPGQVTNPRIIDADKRIVKTALKYGKIPTLMIQNRKRIEDPHKLGVNCLILGFDSAICMEALKERLQELRVK